MSSGGHVCSLCNYSRLVAQGECIIKLPTKYKTYSDVKLFFYYTLANKVLIHVFWWVTGSVGWAADSIMYKLFRYDKDVNIVNVSNSTSNNNL